MDLIVPHIRTDFDAFASMLCAGRLYPEALPVLPSQVIFRLKEFLSLYRDVADFHNIKYLKKMKKITVDRMIVVDTRKSSQVQEFMPFINEAKEILIYDHHPATSNDLPCCNLEFFPYGANSTGMFLKLVDRGITLTPEEATIILLGIYADTGNLTYPGTRPEDAYAASELMRMDADLQTVNQYLRPHFDPDQRSVFREMLTSAREINMEGYNVVLVKQKFPRPMQGTSVLVSQASDMIGADAIIGVFAADEKPGVQIIVQSHVPEINAAELTAHFDGGGHPGAAAAFLPKADLDGVEDTLLTLLTEVPLPTTKVSDLMTRTVFTVTPDIPVEETSRLLAQRDIRGAPVVNDSGAIIGVISVRDIEKAELNGLMHAPTSGFMTDKVITLEPEAPLITARKLVANRNIGHLPVVENGMLVGIVSRTDILGSMNGLMNGKLQSAAA